MTDSRQPINPNPFLEQAIALSIASVDRGGGPFGAVIVRGDEVVGRGENRVTTTNDPTAHAEIVAIRAACSALSRFSLSGCVLYASCEPCPMCLSACYWARLDAVYYAATSADAADAGFDDTFLYEEFRKPEDARRLRVEAVPGLRGAARTALVGWKRAGTRVDY